jgi:hypothetical protein
MFSTFPTCQVERSPLKAPADKNTAPETKEERALYKNIISQAQKRRRI